MWVLTTPSELLLVERADGDPVFEKVPAPKEPAQPADGGRATASDWKALVKSYQSLRLPLPPADAPLVGILYQVQMIEDRDIPIPLRRFQYLLGFLISQKADKAQLLIGTEVMEIDSDQVQSLLRIDPAKEPAFEIAVENTWAEFPINAALPAAIQCYQRGWPSLADQLLKSQAKASVGFGHRESVFFEPPGLQPDLALKFVAWTHLGNQLAKPASDRSAILKQMQELSAQEPVFQSPECWGLIRSLAVTIEPSRAASGTVERQIDDLVNLDASLWNNTFVLGLPEPLVALARKGWEAIPALINHLGDRRLTRSVIRPLAEGPHRLITVGEVVGILMRELAGDAGLSWTTSPETHNFQAKQVNAWWAEVQKSNEADYLTSSAVPRLPKETRTYRAITEGLAQKYPQRLPNVYRRLLGERPDVSSRDLVQAISATNLGQTEKVKLLIEGTKSPRMARQAEALQALAKLDLQVFESFLIRSLNAMPALTPGRYGECEQVGLAQLCWESQSMNVWHALRDAVQKADVGVRMEVIDAVSRVTDLPTFRKRRLMEFLLAFLDDEAARDVKADTEKYRSCAAGSWPRIEVRNWAAYQLAKQIGLDVSSVAPSKFGADTWQKLRNEVARICEERGIKSDDPSPDEKAKAKEALQKLGVMDLPDEFSEKPLTKLSFFATEVKDADLRHLRYFPLISTVDLTSTAITDEGLKALADCRGLRVLILTDTKITDAGLNALAKLEWMNQLDLSRTAINGAGLPKLAKLTSLREINLDNSKMNDAGLAPLADFPALEQLSLGGTLVTDAGLRHIPAIKRLTSLDLFGTAVTDAGTKSLGDCAQLESLGLSLTKVSDQGLANLARLPKLKRLFLFGLPITDRGVADLSQLRGLVQLSLTSPKVTDKGAKSLSQLRDLQILYLSQTGITDQGMQELKDLKDLVRLDLSGTAITDKSLEVVRSLPKLQRIVLTDTKITKQAKQDLRQARSGLEVVD